jgi:hypothetical protein
VFGDLGFETIGNATLIAHDHGPVLATDPWLGGTAYFGSWALTHAVPEEQADAVRAASYVFVSHGHPDHLHFPSLDRLRDRRVLLADHVGGRLRDDLRRLGFDVEVLPDRRWRQLSPRVRVMAIADPSQDSVLIVDLDGTLVVDANDATDHGWGSTVRRIARHRSGPVFLLALSGYGDADMMNFFSDDGTRLTPRAALRIPPGRSIVRRMRRLGARFFVPFSSMHRYQREDSAWANRYVTPIEDHRRGFDAPGLEMTPAFVRYDGVTGELSTIDPDERPREIHAPREFGDDWCEPLDAETDELIRSYFTSMTSLATVTGEVVFRIGGCESRVPIDPAVERRVTFEVPRHSLVEALRGDAFDDLLIGNFMRTTLHGDWAPASFESEFSRRVAKYGDNGRARTPQEVDRYLRAYRSRAPIDAVRFALRRRAGAAVRGASSAWRRRDRERPDT